eukprot:m.273939 g.273939  ORF g.273939 m.273939 type:complete len:483 (+) comp26890_c0_seq1:388-1836(+)
MRGGPASAGARPLSTLRVLVVGVTATVLFLAPGAHSGTSCCKAKAGAVVPTVPDPTAVEPPAWDADIDGDWEAPPVAITAVRGLPRWKWEFQAIATDSAPWLLVGIVIVAVARPFVAPLAGLLTRREARGGGIVAQAAAGAAVGLLLPCCSCGVLPIATGVIAGGGSSIAAIAMAFVSSGSGIDSFFYTVGAAGYAVAFARQAGVALLGILAAVAVALTSSRRAAHPPTTKSTTKSSSSSTSNDGGSGTYTAAATAGCCDSVLHEHRARSAAPLGGGGGGFSAGAALSSVATSAIATFEDVALSIGVGIALTAAMTAWGAEPEAPPDTHDGVPAMTSVWGRLELVSASLPLQMCEHAVVHLCTGLQAKGVSPGAVFAFLVVAPSTSVGWFILVLRHDGITAAIAAGLTVVVGALAASYGVDGLDRTRWAPDGPVAASGGGTAPELPRWFSAAAPVVLTAIAATAVLRALAVAGRRPWKVKQA